MRHLYRSHPGKPAKPKASLKALATKPVQPPPTPPNQATSNPERSSSSQVHPFILLSEQQRTVYVARVLSAVFAVCLKQMEEKKGQQEGQEGRHDQHKNQTSSKELDSPREPFLALSNDAPTANPKLKRPAPKAQPSSPNQIYPGKLDDDSGSEDSDDDDGGVTLFGPTLGSLPLRLHDGDGEVDGLEGDLDLD
jgi:hypothetical protein